MSKSRMAGSKEFRDKIEERKGTEWYDKASKVGELHDAHMSKEDPGVARYSGAEIRAEMRAGRGDMTTEELTKKYEDMYASGEINLNGNAKEFLREQHGANLVRNGDSKPGEDKGEPEVSIPETPSESAPAPSGPNQSIDYQPSGPGFGVGGQQIQNVNQDNDIISNVTGDNNTVTNTQDNSVKQYGGSNVDFSSASRSKYLRDKYVSDVSRFMRAN
jgi:hypothetical protein